VRPEEEEAIYYGSVGALISIEDVYHGVHDGFVLGTGVSGIARVVTHKVTGVEYAVKCIDLSIVGEEQMKKFREEIYIMCQLDHPNVIRLEEVYETSASIYLVMELCRGGDLFDCLYNHNQTVRRYSEYETAKLGKQMLSALQYLHSKGIIHRDLKLENFLFSTSETSSELKLIDFGLSKHFKVGEIHYEAVGTPYTAAPEILASNCYDERSDVWSIGVLIYMLLSGEPPFGGLGEEVNLTTLRNKIASGVPDFTPDHVWSNISDEAMAFINGLLVIDPKFRPTAANAKRFQWLTLYNFDTFGDFLLRADYVRQLVKYKGYGMLRKLLCKVVSLSIYPYWFHDFQLEFNKFETNDFGEVTLEAFKAVFQADWKYCKVEDVFDAICLTNTNRTFVRCDFFAALYNLCDVDSNSLSIAFARIDIEDEGFICTDDIIRVLKSDGITSKETASEMFMPVFDFIESIGDRISCYSFLKLLKGQIKEDDLLI